MTLSEYHLRTLIDLYGKMTDLVFRETQSLVDSYESQKDMDEDTYIAGYVIELKEIRELLDARNSKYAKAYKRIVEERELERTRHYREVLSQDNPLETTLLLLDEVLQSRMSDYEKSKHIQIIKDLASNIASN